MTNATNIFATVVASINVDNTENFKWNSVVNADRPEMIRRVALQAIRDSLGETDLTSREQRSIFDVVRTEAGLELTGICVPQYLMKNEIAAINKIVLSSI